MGMFIASIKNIAGDCERTHRWCLANLTDDDGNDTKREKLTQLRIIKIGTKQVQGMHPNGKIYTLEPARIQKVW